MRCLSLFSGCGGLDLGFREAGFEIVMGVDNEPACAESHRLNFEDTPFYPGSISDFVQDLASNALPTSAPSSSYSVALFPVVPTSWART